MKKYLLFFLVGIFFFDPADLGSVMAAGPGRAERPGISQQTSLSEALMKKKRKRRKSKRGKGRSKGPMALAGAGLVYSLPMGDFADGFKGSVGFGVDGEYFVAPTFSIGGHTGMYRFSDKFDDNDFLKFDKASYSVIPLQIKGSLYLTEGPFAPYIGLALGMYINKQTINYQTLNEYYNPVLDTTQSVWLKTESLDMVSKFGLAPYAGFLADISDQMALNFNLRYGINPSKDDEYGLVNANFLGINLGMVFKF